MCLTQVLYRLHRQQQNHRAVADIVSLTRGQQRDSPRGHSGLSIGVISERSENTGKVSVEQRGVHPVRKA